MLNLGPRVRRVLKPDLVINFYKGPHAGTFFFFRLYFLHVQTPPINNTTRACNLNVVVLLWSKKKKKMKNKRQ